MSEPNKEGTDIMMALLMGLNGPRSSKAWNESQQIKAESFLTLAEHWINQTAEENARLKAEVEQARKISGEGMSVTLDLNNQLLAENARLKAEVERLTLENSQYEEHHKYGQNVITSLREEVERLKEGNECLDQMHEKEMARSAFLCEQVDRLTKAVMHSPAAQLKLKELEGKTTFEDINPKDDNSNITTELLVLCNRQASDIRRLTKAGDAMAEEIALAKRQDEGSRFDPIEMHYDHELIVKWNAAKEGKSGA